MASNPNLFLRYENRTVFKPPQRAFLPVTLITGFLGAGKTTLVQHILTNRVQLKVAAAVNDYAALNIDSALVQHHDPESGVVELSNGCICCSMKEELEDTVWKMINGEAPRGSTARGVDIDYLLVETSGVTDPYTLIASLEQKFGKMTRVRLDSVICVVDADVLAESVRQGTADANVAAVSQMHCADVVLLNKQDLVSKEERALVESYVQRVAPHAQRIMTTRSRVPLERVLDVQARQTAGAVITHESARPTYVVAESGGRLRLDKALRIAEDEANHRGHLETDAFTAVAFESAERVGLRQLQDTVMVHLPPSVYRLKGIFALREDHPRLMLSTLQMSGRRRFEFTRDDDSDGCAESTLAATGAATHTQMVAIGQNMNRDATLAVLERIVARRDDNDDACVAAESCESQMARASALVDADLRFEVLARESEDTSLSDTHVLYFRATGARLNHSTVRDLEELFGVDMDTMNVDLCRAVNATGSSVFLTYTRLEHSNRRTLFLRFAFGGRASFLDSVWPIVQREAKSVLRFHLRRVKDCKCGL